MIKGKEGVVPIRIAASPDLSCVKLGIKHLKYNAVCFPVLTGLTIQFLLFPGYQLVFGFHCTVEDGESAGFLA